MGRGTAGAGLGLLVLRVCFFWLLCSTFVVSSIQDQDEHRSHIEKGKKEPPPEEDEEEKPPPRVVYPPPVDTSCPPPPSPSPSCPPPPSPSPPPPPPPPRCAECRSCGCPTYPPPTYPSPEPPTKKLPPKQTVKPRPKRQPKEDHEDHKDKPEAPTEKDVKNLNDLLSVMFVLNDVYLKASLTGGNSSSVAGKAVLQSVSNMDDTVRQMLNEFTAISVAQISALRGILGDRAIPRPANMSIGPEALSNVVNRAFNDTLEPAFQANATPTNLLLAIQSIGPSLVAAVATNTLPALQSVQATQLVAGLLPAIAGQDASMRTVLFMQRDQLVTPYNLTVSDFIQRTRSLTTKDGGQYDDKQKGDNDDNGAKGKEGDGNQNGDENGKGKGGIGKGDGNQNGDENGKGKGGIGKGDGNQNGDENGKGKADNGNGKGDQDSGILGGDILSVTALGTGIAVPARNALNLLENLLNIVVIRTSC